MFNKVNTRYLFIIFIVLLAMVFITVPSGNKKKMRSFKSELSNFEIESVNSFVIYPKAGGESISFKKAGDNWLVADSKGEYNADNTQVENMLGSLSHLRAKRLAAKGKDDWEKFELSDSLATRVNILKGEESLADVYIGKFSYSAPPQAMSPYRQQQGTMTSYVRLGKEKEVYAVDGFLSMTFNRQMRNFRDSRLIQINESDLQNITVQSPAGSYSLVKNDSVWMIDGVLADSASMAKYLSELGHLRSSNFLGEKDLPQGTPSHQLKLEDGAGALMVQVDAFVMDTSEVAVRSTLNPGTWFDGSKEELYSKVFKNKTFFLKSEP